MPFKAFYYKTWTKDRNITIFYKQKIRGKYICQDFKLMYFLSRCFYLPQTNSDRALIYILCLQADCAQNELHFN